MATSFFICVDTDCVLYIGRLFIRVFVLFVFLFRVLVSSEDFCWSCHVGTEFFTSIIREGFIPIADCIVGHGTKPKKRPRERIPSQSEGAQIADRTSGSSTCQDHQENQQTQSDVADSSPSELPSRVVILLPKLNRRRCILAPAEIHVPKNARKRSNRFSMTVNQAFDEVRNVQQ